MISPSPSRSQPGLRAAVEARLLPAVLACAVGVALLPVSGAHAQLGSASHTVRVEVAPVHALLVVPSLLSVQPGEHDLVVGDRQVVVTDGTSELLWLTNGRDKKITVHTDLATPQFETLIQAVSPTAGTAMPASPLSTTPTDFLLSVGRSAGRCTIQYTLTARPETGTGTDSHAVTFTITDQ